MKLAMLALCAVLASCKSAPAPAPAPPIGNTTPKRAERIAIAIAIDDQEVWNGNDQIEPAKDDKGAPNPAHFPGALTGIHAAIAERPLARLAPDARAALVTYSAGAKLRLPMGAIDRLDSAAFGTQRDHYMKIGSDLVQGVERAVLELEREPAERKLLLVVGDGNDTNNDTATPRLRSLRERLAKANIRVRAIVWKSPLSADGVVIGALTDEVVTVTTAAGVGPALVEAVEHAAR